MCDFLLEGFESDSNYNLINYRPLKLSVFGKVARFFEAYYMPKKKSTRFFEKSFIESLKQISPNDNVLIFGIENLKNLLLLKPFIKAKKISLWFWNPLSVRGRKSLESGRFARLMREAEYEPYTFDYRDAEKYGFKLSNQIYRNIDAYRDREQDTDFFFVGCDKKRLAELDALKQKIEEEGFNCYFHVVSDKHTKKPEPRITLCAKKHNIPYSETLEWIGRSRCLVDIMQPGQTGLTLRPLEALFCKKKLLTNNPAIKNESFYHPNNVLILNDNTRSFFEFMSLPYHEPDSAIVEKYDIRHWIKQFEG